MAFFHSITLSAENYGRWQRLKERLQIGNDQELLYRALLSLELTSAAPGQSQLEIESAAHHATPNTPPEAIKPDADTPTPIENKAASPNPEPGAPGPRHRRHP